MAEETQEIKNSFNISRFRSSIEKNGILRNNKFRMLIYAPKALSETRVAGQAGLIDTARYIELWAESTNVPGIAVNTNNLRRYGYGIQEKRPFDTVTNDLNVSFLGDAKGSIWTYFQQWIKLISNYEDSQGMRGERNTGLTPGHKPYELSYKEDYATSAEIHVFTEDGKSAPIKVILQEIFPIMLGDIQLNWGDTNNIMRVPVTFAYKNWYNEYSDQYANPNSDDSASYPERNFKHLDIPGIGQLLPVQLFKSGK